MDTFNLRGALARIETKIDGLVDDAKDHEYRLRALETSRARAAGFAAALGVVGGVLCNIVLGVWKGK